MKDAMSMQNFLEQCLHTYLTLPKNAQEYWQDHPMEFVSSLWQSVVSLSIANQ